MAILGMNSVLAVALQASAPSAAIAPACRADALLESAVTTRIISDRDWKSFSAIAAVRQSVGLEVLPGLAGCPSLKGGATELRRHRPTRALLRRNGLSASECVEIAWALVVADDPSAFGVEPSKAMAANSAFIQARGQDVGRLLHPR